MAFDSTIDTKSQQSNSTATQNAELSDFDKKSSPSTVTKTQTVDQGSFQSKHLTKWESFVDSFKRNESSTTESSSTDLEAQPDQETSSSESKGISTRHVAFIAIAGGLGTGLLVGNGKALTLGGPGGLIISYFVVGTMLFCTILAAGELAVAYSSVPGGFNAYASKLVDPSLGFAVSWNYAINWFTVLPLEMVTASMTIKFWNTSVNSDVFVAIFFTFVVLVNFFGARGYAEAEFWFNLAKVSMLLGFIILAIIIDVGGAGNGGFIGAKYFHTPGAFAHGFKGVCAVFVTSTFSLGGTEFLALTAADQKFPSKAIPSATKQVIYRLVIFYFGSILMVGFLVPSNSDQLMGSGHNGGAPVSPYVIAVESYGVKIVPHIINAVILIAVLSVGNSALYSSSRTFYSLAQQGFAPKWFDFVDKKNRPTRAMLVSTVFGLFSFIAAYEDQESIFVWLLSLAGLATIFTWTTICLSHLRFRKALEIQGVSMNELGFKSSLGVWGSYYAILLNAFILVVQFWVSLFPINNDGKADIVSFFQNYLGMFTFMTLYVGHKIYSRNWIPCIAARDIDLDTNRKVFDCKAMVRDASDGEKSNPRTFYVKLLDFWC